MESETADVVSLELEIYPSDMERSEWRLANIYSGSLVSN